MKFSNSPSRAHKFFLLTNYILLGASTSCIFLTLSLRLIPSLLGFLLILLHILTIVPSILSSSASSPSSSSSARQHAAHMAATVILAILHGAVSLMALSRSAEFLLAMRSYVRMEDGVVILRMVGGLGVVVFFLEWVVVVLAFFIRFYVYAEGALGLGLGAAGGGKVVGQGKGEEEVVKDWPWPFQL